MSCLNVNINRVNGCGLKVHCTLVCTINNNNWYLRVPLETVWLTPNNNFEEDIEVHANVSWKIE